MHDPNYWLDHERGQTAYHAGQSQPSAETDGFWDGWQVAEDSVPEAAIAALRAGDGR